MTKPKCLDVNPLTLYGNRYAILGRYNSREWEIIDYAASRIERTQLIAEYRMAFGSGWELKTVQLPKKYWPKGN